MRYSSHQLFSDTRKSLGWFVLDADGTIISHHDSSTEAYSAAGSLNRGEGAPESSSDAAHMTVELYDADGNHVGSVDFNEWGSFIPGSYKLGNAKNASISASSIPGL